MCGYNNYSERPSLSLCRLSSHLEHASKGVWSSEGLQGLQQPWALGLGPDPAGELPLVELVLMERVLMDLDLGLRTRPIQEANPDRQHLHTYTPKGSTK